MGNPCHCAIGGRDPPRKRPQRHLLSRLGTLLIVLVVVSLMFTGEHWLLLEAPASADGLVIPVHAAGHG
jgi:hypothetical protein